LRAGGGRAEGRRSLRQRRRRHDHQKTKEKRACMRAPNPAHLMRLSRRLHAEIFHYSLLLRSGRSLQEKL
jgi:hypothetical protein